MSQYIIPRGMRCAILIHLLYSIFLSKLIYYFKKDIFILGRHVSITLLYMSELENIVLIEVCLDNLLTSDSTIKERNRYYVGPFKLFINDTLSLLK